ncbi:hypothetical protein CSPX01_10566 [Colletotrichum filicis]|nr:hypothetical protein CSPX01_10566 [Colletotrichum filicis]
MLPLGVACQSCLWFLVLPRGQSRSNSLAAFNLSSDKPWVPAGRLALFLSFLKSAHRKRESLFHVTRDVESSLLEKDVASRYPVRSVNWGDWQPNPWQDEGHRMETNVELSHGTGYDASPPSARSAADR